MTKPTICHLGAWGKNWGDRAIQYALQNAVGREEYEWWNVDIQRPDWATAYMFGNDGKPCELMLIGGGGLLWDKPELDSPSGWQWQIKLEIIEGWQHPPIIVHAIGDTRFPYGEDETGHKPEFKESLTILAEKALSFSVRDELTHRILADLDIETTLCPDPALFIGEPRERVPDGPPILGVCLAWDKLPWRWPGKYEGHATFVEYMNALAESLKGFVAQGWQLRPFCHIPEDEPTLTLCRDILKEYARNVEWALAWDPNDDGLDGLIRMYSECTAVVSMRKHGIIVPAGLGVPVVGLGDMAEVKSICEQLSVPLVASDTASPESFTAAIEQAMVHAEEPPSYDVLRAAHDRHISRIRGALV